MYSWVHQGPKGGMQVLLCSAEWNQQHLSTACPWSCSVISTNVPDCTLGCQTQSTLFCLKGYFVWVPQSSPAWPKWTALSCGGTCWTCYTWWVLSFRDCGLLCCWTTSERGISFWHFNVHTLQWKCSPASHACPSSCCRDVTEVDPHSVSLDRLKDTVLWSVNGRDSQVIQWYLSVSIKVSWSWELLGLWGDLFRASLTKREVLSFAWWFCEPGYFKFFQRDSCS